MDMRENLLDVEIDEAEKPCATTQQKTLEVEIEFNRKKRKNKKVRKGSLYRKFLKT